MKQFFALSVLCISLFSCQYSEKKTTYEKNIQGDWVTDFVKNDANKPFYIFSFQDTLCSYLYPSGAYSAFTTHSDTLIITERMQRRGDNILGGEEEYHFRILELNDSNLTLTPITEKALELIGATGKSTDTIRLKKIPAKNDTDVKRIGFYSGPCFGVCPSMYLEIDNAGNILFNGLRYTEKEGLFAGKIPRSELKQILREVRNVDLDNLKKEYTARWTDDQACRIKIETAKKTYETSVYGFDKEPVALRILFHKLMETYKTARLKQDSTILKKFAFPEFQQSGFPTPPARNSE
ncbi:DUF6438 domain-containing protein [Sinomicrobium sp. M5D2P17]